jgi:DNA-binding response OmpR family regulator
MGHRAPVLALDATGHPARRVRALDAGADDCLSDPFAVEELAGQAGRVLSRADLMLRVWGFPAGADSNALAVYVGYLRRKLEAGGEPRLLHTVRGVGYVVRQG